MVGRDVVLIDETIEGNFGLPDEPTITYVFPEPGGYVAVVSQGVLAKEVGLVAQSLAEAMR